MTILYSDMERLSHYSPVTPATRILNENPELNTIVHNMLFLTHFLLKCYLQ